MALLRQQQQRLAVVKAVKVFFGNQNFLRTILKQQVSFTFKARVPLSLSLQHVQVVYLNILSSVGNVAQKCQQAKI